ncbi:hypothetical protein ASE01_13740 [Nocardioides sp. Root190]|uniref:hypothetical protein n=1 Tax=Nocardioides sp. Root190 TaxID=1736488 RepID=UPI0006F58C89|nr:hypothetical protein [Nocardioides sp. Root190]KRB76088.1 hypothetical protein ASE01_13740 [Nocardioides sp. Root190]
MSTRALGYAAVIRGAFRGFGVLLVGGLVHPAVMQLAEPLGYVWLLLVALVAFGAAAVAATPPGTPVSAWRQAPAAAVGSYFLIVPLVRAGAGELPLVQLLLTTVTAVLVGVAVGLARTSFEASRASSASAAA